MVFSLPEVYIPSFGAIDDRITFGNNQIQLMTDYHLLNSLLQSIERDPDTGAEVSEVRGLLLILLKDEIFRVHTWLSPLVHNTSIAPASLDEASLVTVVERAWRVDPYLAVHLSERFMVPSLLKEIRRLILLTPEDVIQSPLAAEILLGDTLSPDLQFQLKVFYTIFHPNCSTYYTGRMWSRQQQ